MTTTERDLEINTANTTTTASRLKNNTTKSTISQCVAVFISGSMSFSLGVMFVFPTIVVGSIIETTDEILSLTKEQASWYGSLAFMVQPIGCLTGGILQNYIGRKQGMLLATLPALIAWILLYTATSLMALNISAVLMGIGIGFTESPVAAYITEVTDPRLRGVLFSCVGVQVTSGTFLVFFLVSIVTWRVNALICASLPVISIILLLMVPESPYWLINKGRKEEAWKALCWLRGWVNKECIDSEFLEIIHHIEPSTTQSSHDLQSFLHKESHSEVPSVTKRKKQLLNELLQQSTLLPILFITGYEFFTVCASDHGARSYMFNIFRSVGSPTESLAFVSGAASLLGNFTCILTLRYLGKRKQALASMLLCSLTSVLLGIYVLYKDELAMPSTFSFLFYVLHFSSYLGNQNIPWMLMAELFPISTRSMGIALCATIFYVFFFTFTKTYFYFESIFGTHGLFIMNGIIGLLGCVYLFLYLPETEGKSLVEIEIFFSKKSKQ